MGWISNCWRLGHLSARVGKAIYRSSTRFCWALTVAEVFSDRHWSLDSWEWRHIFTGRICHLQSTLGALAWKVWSGHLAQNARYKVKSENQTSRSSPAITVMRDESTLDTGQSDTCNLGHSPAIRNTWLAHCCIDLHGQTHAIVNARLLARVVAAIQITGVRWRSRSFLMLDYRLGTKSLHSKFRWAFKMHVM